MRPIQPGTVRREVPLSTKMKISNRDGTAARVASSRPGLAPSVASSFRRPAAGHIATRVTDIVEESAEFGCYVENVAVLSAQVTVVPNVCTSLVVCGITKNLVNVVKLPGGIAPRITLAVKQVASNCSPISFSPFGIISDAEFIGGVRCTSGSRLPMCDESLNRSPVTQNSLVVRALWAIVHAENSSSLLYHAFRNSAKYSRCISAIFTPTPGLQANFAFTGYAVILAKSQRVYSILVKESSKRVRLTSTSRLYLVTKTALMISLEMNELFEMANDLESISVRNTDRDQPRNQFRALQLEQRQMIEQNRQPKTRQDAKRGSFTTLIKLIVMSQATEENCYCIAKPQIGSMCCHSMKSIPSNWLEEIYEFQHGLEQPLDDTSGTITGSIIENKIYEKSNVRNSWLNITNISSDHIVKHHPTGHTIQREKPKDVAEQFKSADTHLIE
uniref:Uncharacterized protein n=1 Tax=Glossina austeni TaxID=7395 RepID=A0A1A9VIQ7_GLOAU